MSGRPRHPCLDHAVAISAEIDKTFSLWYSKTTASETWACPSGRLFGFCCTFSFAVGIGIDFLLGANPLAPAPGPLAPFRFRYR